MKTIKAIIFSSLFLISSLFAREVGVAWDANPPAINPAHNVSQYRVYRVDSGLKTLLATSTGLSATINAETGWSVALTAFNGLENPLSDSVVIPAGPPPSTSYTVVSVSSEDVARGDHQIGMRLTAI